MTVGSNVKSCYASIKNIEATLELLIEKSQKDESKEVYEQTKQIVAEIKSDLQQQLLYLAREEPQYKQ